jgi:hypothetical protein
MPTLADFQEDAPRAQPAGEFVPLADTQPDIVKHDSNTFAALTAQSALSTMYQQGLQPTGDDIKGIYSKALQDSAEYHRSIAEEQERAQLELKKRATAVQAGVLSAEEQVRTEAEIKKQQQLEQFRQGPSAAALAEQQGGKGLVAKLPETDLARLDGLVSGYDTASNLHNYFDQMAQKTVGAGGVLKSGMLGTIARPELTSPEYRNFNAYLESSIVPLGRGVFGDAAVAATKENIQAQMKDMLPNPTDNPLSGGNKIYMLKDRIMQNLQTLRDDRAAAGFDTTPIDRQIGRINSDLRSDRMTSLNPLKTQPVVQTGTSNVATATMDAQLIRSAQQQQQNQSYVGGSMLPNPAQQPGLPAQQPAQQPPLSLNPAQNPQTQNQSGRYFGAY